METDTRSVGGCKLGVRESYAWDFSRRPSTYVLGYSAFCLVAVESALWELQVSRRPYTFVWGCSAPFGFWELCGSIMLIRRPVTYVSGYSAQFCFLVVSGSRRWESWLRRGMRVIPGSAGGRGVHH